MTDTIGSDLEDIDDWDDAFSDTYTEDKSAWDSITFAYVDDKEVNELKQSDIISTYAIVLNKKRELLLYHMFEWKLPGGYISTIIYDDIKQCVRLQKTIKDQLFTDVEIKNAIGMKIYKKKEKTKYTVFFYAEVSDDAIDQKQLVKKDVFASLNDSGSVYDEKREAYFCRWSQLVDLPVYAENRCFIDKIYGQWKMRLVLDLDHTLLESTMINPNITDSKFDVVGKNDNLLKANHIPAQIIPFVDHTRYVWTRPYLKEFMTAARSLASISFWTAGSYSCQSRVLDRLSLLQYGDSAHYYNSCSYLSDGYPYKDFVELNKKLDGNVSYDLFRTLLIDDLSINKEHNMGNCLQIMPWKITGSSSSEDLKVRLGDDILLRMIPLLKKWSDCIIHDNISVSDLIEQKENQFISLFAPKPLSKLALKPLIKPLSKPLSKLETIHESTTFAQQKKETESVEFDKKTPSTSSKKEAYELADNIAMMEYLNEVRDQCPFDVFGDPTENDDQRLTIDSTFQSDDK